MASIIRELTVSLGEIRVKRRQLLKKEDRSTVIEGGREWHGHIKRD